jgi:pimeloyl-ACP methyl ester carboxylesterase
MHLFTRAALGRAGLEQMTDARREQARDNLETFASQLTQAEFPALDAQDLRRITMPTLLLTGEKSPSLMRKLTDRLQERLPHASRVSIPGASHDAHVDNASAVTDAIDGFLGALETTSGRERHGLHGSAPGRS